MLHLKSIIENPQKIKIIIFDFGGVICDLDINKTVEKFKAFGPSKPGFKVSAEKQNRNFEMLVEQIERSRITPQQFRDSIRNHYISEPSDPDIDDAWNAMLTGIPPERIKLLENIRKNYRVFLLSNSNEIHYQKYLADFKEKYGYEDFSSLFEKTYFSFRINLIKPDKDVFEFVLADSGLNPGETLFIDDMLKNVEAARQVGINGYHLKPGEDILDLFSAL
jgi:putative hydrolase of the HAD superfamily